MSEQDAVELYRRHRPAKFSEVVGQDDVVRMLVDMGKRKAVPHFLLFTGPSGCGKTTLARILRQKLKCSDFDFKELNCADFRGIDMVREIRNQAELKALNGDCRVWLIDEAHRLTTDAQNAFLKLLEDTPSHVYFFLATTDPQKLLATIKTRATEVKVRSVKDDEMEKLVRKVYESECGVGLHDEVCEKLVRVAEGSPRKALVLLAQAMTAEDLKDQIATIEAGDSSREGIELARALMQGKSWKSVADILKNVDGEPEGIRRLVLGYCSSVLLGGGSGADQAFWIMDCFSRNFYDTGKAGLISASYEVLAGRRV